MTANETRRRRTFAIISHPDAGKTTLTEKFLLYAGALGEAGSVKARAGRRSTTSDWMEMEQKRGISISSTAIQFPYRDHVLNLLDTPGHRDFSEDTYRVLAAVDAVVMVLDSAKGIEPQTLKLFEVCRSRRSAGPDVPQQVRPPRSRPARVARRDREADRSSSDPRHVARRVAGRVPRCDRQAHGPLRPFHAYHRGSAIAPEEEIDSERAAAEEGSAWFAVVDECGLLDAVGADVDLKSFLAGESTPVFVGSALTNFGVRHLLEAIIDLAPAPSPRLDVDGVPRAIDSPCSAFVFKVQANMDRSHRDRIVFVRICSGRFERGMVLTSERTGKPFATKYASTVFGAERSTVDLAFPGDVVGLVNATGLNIGDSLFDGDPVRFPPIPASPRRCSRRRGRSTPVATSSSAAVLRNSTRRGWSKSSATPT